jgi:hypothetical protein
MARWPHETGYGGLSTEALPGRVTLCPIYNLHKEDFSDFPTVRWGKALVTVGAGDYGFFCLVCPAVLGISLA